MTTIEAHGTTAPLARVGADRPPHRDPGGLEIMEAMDIDAEVVGCHTLSMKRVDAANAAEEMPCRLGMKLVLGERRFSGKEPELALVHLDHERVLAPADRTITHGEFWEVGLDLELNGAAMATSLVALIRATTHDVESPMWGRCA